MGGDAVHVTQLVDGHPERQADLGVQPPGRAAREMSDQEIQLSLKAQAAVDDLRGQSRIPAVEPEEDLVLRLLADHDVLVHPGYFFDFPREGFLELSLLPRPDLFAAGVDRLWNGLSR